MILVHEYMHIILGHCDTICTERAFLWENDDIKENPLGTFNTLSLQAIEMFADQFFCYRCRMSDNDKRGFCKNKI